MLLLRLIRFAPGNVAARCVGALLLVGMLLSAPRLVAQPVPAGSTPGIPWTGAVGVSERIDEIMARESVRTAQRLSDPLVSKPFLAPSRDYLPQDPASAAVSGGLTDVRTGSAKVVSSGGPKIPQSVGVSFLGAQLSEAGFIPPDSNGAVGPSQVLVCVNGRIKLFDKTGVLGGLDTTTDIFFASVRNGSTTSDPHTRYDRLSGRWFVVMINTVSQNNSVLLAVSSGPTITDASSFTFFSFQHNLVSTAGDNNLFADYPTLGVDANALYIGMNIFGTVSFSGTTGFVVRKSSVLGAGPIVVTAFRSLGTSTTAGVYTPQGVDNDDPNATEGYFIGTDTTVFGRLVLRRISTPGGTPSISANLNLTVPTTRNPQGGVVAQGVATPLDDLDDRLFAARLHNGSLWTAHNLEVNASGTASTSGNRDGARWYEITNLTGTPTLYQSGTLFDSSASSPASFWIPTCAVNGQGHMALACSVASPNLHAGIAVSGRLASDTLGTIQAPILGLGSSTKYNLSDGSNPHRWGDYSVMTVDPNDDMTMWTFQEYCNATDSWGVRVIQLLAPPPATPASGSPSSLTQGNTAVDVVLTGTSSSGSGFFDPGSTFSNHIAAAVGGSGVTVNSVTYTDPTHVTLNLTVAGAAATGARTISVTNPDGQSLASASGILTINPAATIAGRAIFYNNSAFDGNNAAATAADDGAIATDKSALLPGGTATFANYTSYSRGINGLMVDIANLAGTPTSSDFEFKVGNDNNPASWTPATAPTSVTVRAGAGAGGSARVTVIWADNAIQKQWLQVTVSATAATGLLANDVFYFGNAVGETGSSTTDALVNSTDFIGARNNPRGPLNLAPITFAYDFNRDRQVNSTDLILARNNQTGPLNALRLITVP